MKIDAVCFRGIICDLGAKRRGHCPLKKDNYFCKKMRKNKKIESLFFEPAFCLFSEGCKGGKPCHM